MLIFSRAPERAITAARSHWKTMRRSLMNVLDLQALETAAAEALVPGSTVSSGC